MLVKRRIKTRIFVAKQSWQIVGGRKIFFRSNWEFKVAKLLQMLKEKNEILEWEHEPKTFWFEEIKRGTRSYLPDFKVTRPDKTHYWIEVKGYMDRKSKTKIKRFKKYYPDEEIMIVEKDWFIKNLI